MKTKLLTFLVAFISLGAFSQAHIGFYNDSAHLFVIGTPVPGDPTGPIPASPLPSGNSLVAQMYAGTSPDSMTLYATSLLDTNGWGPTNGLMVPIHLIASGIPANSTAYFNVVISDVVGPLGSPFVQGPASNAVYYGTSGTFSGTPPSSLGYPALYSLGGTSTWTPTNLVINSVVTNWAPHIDTQPQSLSVTIGSNATLKVSASSSQTLTYQWRKDGVEINGATKSAIDFVSVVLSNAGNYVVVCSNLSGQTISSNAVLQVLPFSAPSIRVNGELAVGTVQVISPTVTISGGFPSGILFYTLDGSAPTTSSPVYAGPITLAGNTTVQAMSLSADFTQTSTAPAVTVLLVPVYSLQATVNGNGTIMVTPPNGPYSSNTLVTLTANGATNWAFDHWSGDLSGTNNPATLLMNGPRNVTAVFLPTIYPLTVGSPGGGSVTANGLTIASNTFYSSGSVVTLTANASNGWGFTKWQGTATGTANPLNLVMNQTNDVQAIFGTMVTTNIGGRGSITMSQPNPVPFGTALTLTAVPAPGYHFVAWSGAASGTINPTVLIVTNANPAVGAFFGGPPVLTIKTTATNTTVVSWPSPSTGWSLLVNTNLATSGWVVPAENIYDNGTIRYLLVSPPAGNRFYQLRTQ